MYYNQVFITHIASRNFNISDEIFTLKVMNLCAEEKNHDIKTSYTHSNSYHSDIHNFK